MEGSPHLTEGEVMEYSHWEYNTDDEDGEDNEQDIYTDDEEADAASDEHQDYWQSNILYLLPSDPRSVKVAILLKILIFISKLEKSSIPIKFIQC